jgi:threonyl-tRNA synthetase
MLVIGDKEVETLTLTPRFRDGRNIPPMKPSEFVDFIAGEVTIFH